MEGFTVLELCPLSEEQIYSIKDKWLGTEDTTFIGELKRLPYYDVADRPLLLTQLLFIYHHYGYLPDQPSQIYQKLVNLLLEDWDAERNIRRDSRYSGFDPGKKAEFLSSLAYRLTYPELKTNFKEVDLIKVYLSICARFRLPEDEAIKVAREIQTHNGILLAGPRNTYEFCHLSLQEYLCAEYIVRSPLETQSIEILSNYPAPLAVAVALSSNPSYWFGNFILQFRNLSTFAEGNMASFLSRVLVENPDFEANETLGFAIILLFRHYHLSPSICKYLNQMIERKLVLASVARALRWYDLKTRSSISSEFIEVSLKRGLERTYKFDLPNEGAIPRKYLDSIKGVSRDSLFT